MNLSKGSRRPRSLVLSSSPSLSVFTLALAGVAIPVQAQTTSSASSSATTTAQSACFPLKGSELCSAFDGYYLSRSQAVYSLYPFVEFVSDSDSFDELLKKYIATDFSKQRYRDRIGCSAVNLTNTNNIYARYTTSIVCNALVQLSKNDCASVQKEPAALCADTCAQYALSEQQIVSSPELCGTPSSNSLDLIRADFIDCSLPDESLVQGDCITGVLNEPDNCGYRSNLGGLCSFCAASSPNSTDSCCVNSQAETRCENVRLPTTTAMVPLFPSSTTAAAESSGSGKSSGLSAGAIAGIAVGSIIGAALLGLVAFVLLRRRYQHSKKASGHSLNQPTPSRQGPGGGSGARVSRTFGPPSSQDVSATKMAQTARVTGFEALKDDSKSVTSEMGIPSATGPAGDRASVSASAGLASPLSSHFSPSVRNTPKGKSIELPSSPAIAATQGTPQSRILNSSGGLTGAAAIAALQAVTQPPSRSTNRGDTSSDQSSPEGAASSNQSEQLAVFYDYYSQEPIVPGSVVATLWAYQPRAPDEFELDRGVMIRIVGIWDDGWATGVRLSERVEEWEAHRENRDSGVSHSNQSVRPTDRTPPSGPTTVSDSSKDSTPSSDTDGEEGVIKAFPLVCVCLPQHWRKAIDGGATSGGGDSSTGLNEPAIGLRQEPGMTIEEDGIPSAVRHHQNLRGGSDQEMDRVGSDESVSPVY